MLNLLRNLKKFNLSKRGESEIGSLFWKISFFDSTIRMIRKSSRMTLIVKHFFESHPCLAMTSLWCIKSLPDLWWLIQLFIQRRDYRYQNFPPTTFVYCHFRMLFSTADSLDSNWDVSMSPSGYKNSLPSLFACHKIFTFLRMFLNRLFNLANDKIMD